MNENNSDLLETAFAAEKPKTSAVSAKVVKH